MLAPDPYPEPVYPYPESVYPYPEPVYPYPEPGYPDPEPGYPDPDPDPVQLTRIASEEMFTNCFAVILHLENPSILKVTKVIGFSGRSK